MKLELKIFMDPGETGVHIAEDIKNLVDHNADGGRNTFIAVSGGNTPKILFETLSGNFKDSIAWERLHLFWGDERCVPPQDNQSNYGMTKKYLLDNIDIPGKNIHRVRGEEDPEREVVRIAEEIDSTVPAGDILPRFDLNVLGLGEDGHTASLFPGKKLKNVSRGIAGIAVHPASGQKRISMTKELINNSRQIIFMVTGRKKADIVYRIMSRKGSDSKYPAAGIKAAEILKWYLDKEAASKIKMP